MRRRKSPEHELQCAIMDYWNLMGRRDMRLVAIPNGELRHINVARRLKDEGVRPGTPDLVVTLEGGRAGWLECKARRGGLSDEQIGFRAIVERLGHHWALVRTVDDAAMALASWGALRGPGWKDAA